ncbi:hypothetical protein CRG98_007824 [Punica granatum]|uniref:Senescence domain-containing protein n=1 Tax=Punica granatum TaxID=22663 RepID=A0A2I0KTL9_PUNGR|nr:hypothetical protein CRG98_007824 [Punica granatum]
MNESIGNGWEMVETATSMMGKGQPIKAYNIKFADLIKLKPPDVAREILWSGKMICSLVDLGGSFILDWVIPRSDEAKVSPRTMKNLKRIIKPKKITNTGASMMWMASAMNATEGSPIMGECYYINWMLTKIINLSAIIQTGSQNVCGYFYCGGRVSKAVDLSGKDAIAKASSMTVEIVRKRYGEEAGQANPELLEVARHFGEAAWAILKIRNAIFSNEKLTPAAC